jgi:hypothetical protein
MHGQLSDLAMVATAADDYWQGLEAWCAARGLVIETQLARLLANAATIET